MICEGQDASDMHCINVMTKDPACVDLESSALDALRMMVQRNFRHLPVVHEGSVCGLLHIQK